MKNVLILSILVSLSFSLISQPYYVDDSGEEVHLWGVFDTDRLMHKNYKTWYDESVEDYEFDLSKFDNVDGLSELNVKVFLGTWCGDSKNWVPKFIELWDSIGLSKEQIELIAVHNKSEYYKQGPNGEEQGVNVHRVPTFVFYKDNEEVARIVEQPLNSLETDLAQINSGLPSQPRYAGVTYLNDYFKTADPLTYQEDKKKIIYALYREVHGAGELNTYGYVLKAAGLHDQAHFVFSINTRLFPYTPNCYDSLAESFHEQGDHISAIDNYKKVLQLKPDDERVKKIIDEIN